MINIEELSLIKALSAFKPNKKATLDGLRAALPDVEPELQSSIKELIDKIEALSPEEFANLDLSDTLDNITDISEV